MPKRAIVGAFLAALSACGNEQTSPSAREETAADAYSAAMDAAAAATAAASEAPSPIPLPPPPAHRYDARDGLVYSYVAAISEEERKAGKGAGDVVSFAYLGVRDGQHILARVGRNNSITGYAHCRKPCVIIAYDDGEKVAYNEGSIIGAAFADALAGRLKVAQASGPRPVPAAPSSPMQTNSPAPAPANEPPNVGAPYSPSPASADEADKLSPCAVELAC